MCGINGGIGLSREQLVAMNKAISHRGPDGSGVYVDSKIALGQLRLAIIDITDAGFQPMFYSKIYGACSEKFQAEYIKDSNLSIVFNGEIYNYIEIRNELQKKGYKFSSGSDTEVILAAYAEYGRECVHKFNGMWAFAIHDIKKDVLFCSRDRFGVKPFYYSLNYTADSDRSQNVQSQPAQSQKMQSQNSVSKTKLNKSQFIFSSELKGLLASGVLAKRSNSLIDNDALELYFALGFIPAPKTIFSDILKLESGHSLVYDLSKGKASVNRWYELPSFSPQDKSEQEWLAEGRELLSSSIAFRMRSDVPVGAFLSGGLDSSSVVAGMRKLTDVHKLHTFSVGFEGKYDESKYIKIVQKAFGTKHHHFYFHEKDFDKITQSVAKTYDEPFSDTSMYPTFFVSKEARKKVTVALSGDGGDEIFGGYYSYVTAAQLEILYKVPRVMRYFFSKLPAKKSDAPRASWYLLREACKASLFPKSEVYANLLLDDAIRPPAYKQWMTKNFTFALKKAKGNLAEAARIFDLLFGSLPDHFLVKVDRASMAHALEVRSPFLDYRFIEFAQRLPTALKNDTRKTKIFMRKLVSGIVPDAIITRGKQGFSPPIADWIMHNKHLKQLAKDVKFLEELHVNIANKYLEEYLVIDTPLSRMYKVRLFQFGRWYDNWVDI